jgi:hypothetical protein
VWILHRERDLTEEKRGLPHLARPGDELNASGRALGQAAAERFATAGVVETRSVRRHVRIIIRLSQKVNGASPWAPWTSVQFAR